MCVRILQKYFLQARIGKGCFVCDCSNVQNPQSLMSDPWHASMPQPSCKEGCCVEEHELHLPVELSVDTYSVFLADCLFTRKGWYNQNIHTVGRGFEVLLNPEAYKCCSLKSNKPQAENGSKQIDKGAFGVLTLTIHKNWSIKPLKRKRQHH